jgi:hypothetical protein
MSNAFYVYNKKHLYLLERPIRTHALVIVCILNKELLPNALVKIKHKS